ncbi:MAG TPA: pentapeptide repeat-containing protein, partial [Allocoleopsis sp.]
MNADEIRSRYAAGERDFRDTDLSGADLRGANLS